MSKLFLAISVFSLSCSSVMAQDVDIPEFDQAERQRMIEWKNAPMDFCGGSYKTLGLMSPDDFAKVNQANGWELKFKTTVYSLTDESVYWDEVYVKPEFPEYWVTREYRYDGRKSRRDGPLLHKC